MGIKIVNGVVSSDHIHVFVEIRPHVPVSDYVKKAKGRSSRRIQEEYPEIRKRYCGCHLWASGTCFGQKTLQESIPVNGKKDEVLPPQDLTHSFGIALEYIHYYYSEPDVYQSMPYNTYGARWVKDIGSMWGGSTFYRLAWKNTLFLQPEIRLLYGKNQYNWGQKKNLVNKTQHAIPSLIFEPRLIIGGHSPSFKRMTFSPYTGIGYRFKSDDSEEVRTSQGHNLGHYRKSNYVYIPLGASAEYNLNDTWSVYFKGEYDLIIKAWQYTRTSIERPTIDKQPNGYGFKGEVSISYLYQKVQFSVSPYINYWNIRNSKKSKGGGMEPYNLTWESGMKLGVTF